VQPAGHTFLVTGGASGLGAGVARHFAAIGAQVVIADLNAAAGEALAAELGAIAHFVATDVASAASGQAAVEAAVQRFGGLHGLVSCAGILGAARIVGREGPHDLDLFRRVIEVNLVGTFNMLRLAATAMSASEPNAAGERGVIVNTASVSACEGQIGQAAYAASKGGVASLTLPAARELARLGIRVVAIAPGGMDTPLLGHFAAPEGARLKKWNKLTSPMGFATPDDIANAVLFVASDEARFITGAIVAVDGGITV